LFLGPLVPVRLLRPRLIPVLPDIPGLVFQAVHTDDVAEVYRRAIVGHVAGPFNLAADPVLDLSTIAERLGARTIRVPAGLARRVVEATWWAHVQPTPVGWLEMGLQGPVMSSDRARRELAWSPRRSSLDAVVEVLEGISSRSGERTPRLRTRVGGHVSERVSGIGSGRRPAA
jgi:UDP-glucose 4-epimerase